MKRGKNDAETCRLNGWAAGTYLRGLNGWAASTIRITAIGEDMILARCIEWDDRRVEASEQTWTLSCRDWLKVLR